MHNIYDDYSIIIISIDIIFFLIIYNNDKNKVISIRYQSLAYLNHYKLILCYVIHYNLINFEYNTIPLTTMTSCY